MNTSDIEKLQLVPKKTPLPPPASDCKLSRINEVEGGNLSSTSSRCSAKRLEGLSFNDLTEVTFDSYQNVCQPARPATAGMGQRVKLLGRVSTVVSGTEPTQESQSAKPVYASNDENGDDSVDAGGRSPRSHSDTNIVAKYALSPIIIKTSCMPDGQPVELVHPIQSQEQMAHLATTIKDRGFSASLDDINDAKFCIALANCNKEDRTGFSPAVTPSMSTHKKRYLYRTASESTEEGPTLNTEAVALKRLTKQAAVYRGVRLPCTCYCATGADEVAIPRFADAFSSRCACRDRICPCRKHHATSVVNLPSLRKSRRTPGLDEISYDFMRASGAISGFSQLRSVKGIMHDRERQELYSALSPAIAASLDTRGAVALLAASARPRLIASMRKRASRGHSSQEEAPTALKPTSWASSLDSSCNVQSQDDDCPRGGPFRSDEPSCVPLTRKQSFLVNWPANRRGSTNKDAVMGVRNHKFSNLGDTEEYAISTKNSIEQETADDQEDNPLLVSEMPRPKRPYYCQKAQKFRNSWRTQSVESPHSVAEHGMVRGRSLTRVDSQSASDDSNAGKGNGDRNTQVTVYLTRGSRDPVKTILVNHNVANIATANSARLRARRQKTFSNRNQWRSVQLSPTHDVEAEKQAWRADERQLNVSLCNSRDSYLNNRCLHKTPVAHTMKSQLSWKKKNTSPFVTSAASSTDMAKMRQLTKSFETMPASILKAQVSHWTSEKRSIVDDAPCLEPVFTLRQQRIQAMERHRSNSAFHNVGYRLGRRKRMFQQRSMVSDYCLAFAVLGILLMIVEYELTSAHVVTKESICSLLLKSLITCSTLALIGLIILYHIIVVRILSFDDCIEDWQIAWNRARLAKLMIEILICAIHPVPGSFAFKWPSSYYLFGGNILLSCAHCINGTLDPSLLSAAAPVPRVSAISGSPHVIFPSNKVVSIDIILSLPMFLRLYLIFRVVVLHSKLFTDTGSRSIGAMNKVNFTTQFVFKTFMTICPGTVLVAFILGFWAVLAWMLRACERVHDPVFGNLFNSMWLVAVTFLSIGYGDVVANTYCGRAISIVTGVLGSLCTALVVAVFARQLELSKAEKHVIHFMMENTLTKKMKHYAANVLRETWLIYKYTKLVKKLNASTIRKHQRKFLFAIHGLRQVKLEQRKLQDNANTLIDLAKTQSAINDTMSEMRVQHTRIQIRLEAIEESLVRIQEHFATLPVVLKYIQMQASNSNCSNQKSEEHIGSEDCYANQNSANSYTRYRETPSRILNQQSSIATTIHRDDSGLVIHNSAAQIPIIDRLKAATQSAVSFESTQSHKPPSYARDCLNVEPVQRAISEPSPSFPAAVRPT